MDKHKIMSAENMILLGATARNLGKTALAVKFIEKYRDQSVMAVKVITVRNHGDLCPRGGKGCGICRGLKDCFDIREEKEEGEKDTMLFKKAGARAVYLVRTHPEGLADAMAAVLNLRHQDEIIICESNSVRKVLKPQTFIIVTDDQQEMKPSAKEVLHLADEILAPFQISSYL